MSVAPVGDATLFSRFNDNERGVLSGKMP